jgi:hypothetical protein
MAADQKADQGMVGLRNVSWNIFWTCKNIDSHWSMMGAPLRSGSDLKRASTSFPEVPRIMRSITRNVNRLR